MSIVFTTDPQIKRNKEVLLKDDKGMFPPYNSTLLMKTATADKAGAGPGRRSIDQVKKPLTDDAMQELDARVDLDKKTPQEAAAEYLRAVRPGVDRLLGALARSCSARRGTRRARARGS